MTFYTCIFLCDFYFGISNKDLVYDVLKKKNIDVKLLFKKILIKKMFLIALSGSHSLQGICMSTSFFNCEWLFFNCKCQMWLQTSQI
jgi:hypothetical protein